MQVITKSLLYIVRTKQLGSPCVIVCYVVPLTKERLESSVVRKIVLDIINKLLDILMTIRPTSLQKPRCHLPTMCDLYPAVVSTSGSNLMLVSRPSSWNLCMPPRCRPIVNGYLPSIKLEMSENIDIG